MNKISDVVLERARVREVTGVFHSHAALEDAMEALLLSGFDRADIDRVADPEAVRQRIGDIYVAAEELAELISRLVADDADPRACTEVADVQIVLAGIPAAHGQEQRDLVNAKMITNRARSWELTGDGHGQHVEEP